MSFNAIRDNKSLSKFSGFTVGLGVVLLRTPGTGFLVTGPKYEKKRDQNTYLSRFKSHWYLSDMRATECSGVTTLTHFRYSHTQSCGWRGWIKAHVKLKAFSSIC